MINSLGLLTGAPVFRVMTNTDEFRNGGFKQIQDAEKAGYLLGAETDKGNNDCGIYEYHAYSVISAFAL